MAVTPAAVRTAAVRTATAGAPRHWLLKPIGFNVNQYGSVHRPLGLARRRMNPRVYRPLVDLSTMEERHIILRYRLDRATIHCVPSWSQP
ncbi:hypothetical protein NDU88_004976 [Pleurodeles waltl]|uniref:Uncharacterized protein n=1 Tax=Pleurodeles waltl TaxID=8319 RepID=A0AAV7M8L7_PLEWA|nr:hypothetical protein NDU88_004976 [Pleurodeles waltl]